MCFHDFVTTIICHVTHCSLFHYVLIINYAGRGLAERCSALNSPSVAAVYDPLITVKGGNCFHCLTAINSRRFTTYAKSRKILLQNSVTIAFGMDKCGQCPCFIRNYTAKFSIQYNSHGQNCAEGREIVFHFLYDCPLLTRAMMQTLGKQFLGVLKVISSCSVGKLIPF